MDIQRGQLIATVGDLTDVWPCGQFDVCAPPAFVHMFAGAFSGWHQAQNWLASHNHLCHPSFTLGIEHDFVCASYAAASCNAALINRDAQCVLNHQHVMLRCDVQDDWWLQWLHHGINVMCTISFPCQPFSKGGKSLGIEVQDGRVLIQALALCRRFQPVALALENVDQFRVHAHKAVFESFFLWAGYVVKWRMIHDMARFSAAHRNRWLAVLVRRDIVTRDVKCEAFGTQVIAPWCHDMYKFDHPSELAQMLELTPDLLEIYGNSELLPAPKRRDKPKSQHEVLLCRCPGTDQKLATLVSSYSTQHDLSLPHLRKRGIFAELSIRGEKFAFQCPAMWASLLGVVHDLVLPGDIVQIFHMLGNSIAVPHAAIALLGMTANLDLKLSNDDIADILAHLWSDRLTAFNAILVKDGDGFVLIRSASFLRNPTLLRHELTIHDDWDSEWTFLWPDSSSVCIRAQGTCTVNDLLSILGFPSHVLHLWTIAAETYPGIFHGLDFIPFVVSTFTVLFVPSIFQDADCEPVGAHNSVDPTQPWSQLPSGILDDAVHEAKNCVMTLEVVMLDNSTKFCECQQGDTIRVALQNGGLPKELIDHVHPLCNGKRVSLDTAVHDRILIPTMSDLWQHLYGEVLDRIKPHNLC